MVVVVSFFHAAMLLLLAMAHSTDSFSATAASFSTEKKLSTTLTLRSVRRHLEDQEAEQDDEAEEEEEAEEQEEEEEEQEEQYYDEEDEQVEQDDGVITIELNPFGGPQLTYQGCHANTAKFVVCPARKHGIATCSAFCRGGEEYTTDLKYFTRMYELATGREQSVRCNTANMYCEAGADNEKKCYAAYGCWQEDERKYFSCTWYDEQYYMGPYCHNNKIYQGLFVDNACSEFADGVSAYKRMFTKETGTPLIKRNQCASCSISYATYNDDEEEYQYDDMVYGDDEEENQNDDAEQNDNGEQSDDGDAAYQTYESSIPSGCSALAYAGDFIKPVGFSIDSFIGSPKGWAVMFVLAVVLFFLVEKFAGRAMRQKRTKDKLAPLLIRATISDESSLAVDEYQQKMTEETRE